MVDSRINNYIRSTEISIYELKALKVSLDEQILDCKISNTAGNAASIAGIFLLFTPFFFLGLGALGVGVSTSIGASLKQHFIEKDKIEKIKQILLQEEEHEFSKTAVKVLGGTTKGFLFYMKANDIKRIHNVSSGCKVAYNGVNGASNTIKAGTKLTPFAKVLGGVGVAFSAADIIMTWGMDNETSKKTGDLIKEKEEKLKELRCFNNNSSC